MSELGKTIVECVDKLADKASSLTPLLQVIAVIIGLTVIGVMVAKGGK
ncbi:MULTISPECIES: hypothetical protein [Burkholderia]|uniref:Uncharacterized protein n=1 Tax=Burkholderia stabilis TaxID=95485 RepID=A0AAJ5NBL5_9BURK|nr:MULTISPECIES: hypothetical protein [Burkholderia]CAJ5053607.1 Uncharacterised protein [Burkholderia pseudomallei]CAJ5544791.1 Uncharacterised protein [Burkholderia pseudomallei]CAJ7176180.1 Uncharacterised protein [Burkholderia pseudomallei]CAK0341106.1 Uncharacterised protein [Burkholderia pseudomallei]VBB15434.1 hypothetical protein BSTAB16_5630 [Burkholderia stabilis]